MIGGGIFGASAAIELGKFAEVTIFERRNDLMGEGSYGNQYRHHHGYHYPRSPFTVRQCQEGEADFLLVWEKAIVRNFPAYYCIGKEGSFTSAEGYIKFCEEMGLHYKIAYPPEEFLNPNSVSLSILTKEPVYHYATLKKVAREHFAANPRISLKLENEVCGVHLAEDGRKVLTIKNRNGLSDEPFNFVVNATYANYNVFCGWLGFSRRELEFRLKEIFLIELPVEKNIAVTIMDGPFVTLVPTGDPGIFTLGDVGRSKREIKFGTGIAPWRDVAAENLPSVFFEAQPHDAHFIPIISRAKFIKPIYSILPVAPNTDDTAGRPTDIVNHGYGCWSVFEGKIITSVITAKRIAAEIKASL